MARIRHTSEPKKISVGFRLYAEVDLTEAELKKIISDGQDRTIIAKLVKEGKVKLGGECTDSYIPGPWIADNDDIPASLRKLNNEEDIEVFV